MTSALSLTSFAAAVGLYGIATVLFYLQIARGHDEGRSALYRKLAPWLLAIGALMHGVYVIMASFVAHVCPVHSIHFFLSVSSILATSAYLVARHRFRIHALGLLVAPLGLVVTLGTYFIGTAGPEPRLPASFIGLHVFANLVGVSLFLLACGAAVLYLVQERRFKAKKSTLGKGLPPLDSLDKAAHRFMVLGFPLLTLGAVTGTVWAQRLEQGSTSEVLRAVFGYGTWLLIAAMLLLRVVAGWRGRRSAYGTVASFAMALVVLVIYLARGVAGG
jgi:ABC-type uncharacterized transport system permease subunit